MRVGPPCSQRLQSRRSKRRARQKPRPNLQSFFKGPINAIARAKHYTLLWGRRRMGPGKAHAVPQGSCRDVSERCPVHPAMSGGSGRPPQPHQDWGDCASLKETSKFGNHCITGTFEKTPERKPETPNAAVPRLKMVVQPRKATFLPHGCGFRWFPSETFRSFRRAAVLSHRRFHRSPACNLGGWQLPSLPCRKIVRAGENLRNGESLGTLDGGLGCFPLD